MFNNSNAQEQTVGLFINDTAAFDGYTLFAPNNSTTTYLINMNGLLVHKWESAYLPTQTAYLLENGNLMRSSSIGGGGFQELAWDGTVEWEYSSQKQHHDIEPLPNGNVLMINNMVIDKANAILAGRDPNLITNRLRVLHILEIAKSDTGSHKIVWEWKMWDHLIQDFDSTKANYGVVEEHPELIDLNFASDNGADWIHPNSIDYNPQLDQIIISNRSINEIWVIDHSTTTEEAASHTDGNSGMGGDILYRWGNAASYRAGSSEDQKLFAQHDAQWIEPGLPGAGNIMIFNNGLGRPEGVWSSIDEIVPPVDGQGNYTLEANSAYGPAEQTWIYADAEPTNFYSPRFSGAQRLTNGNTLICSGVGGTFFEITPENEVVWKYINPVDGNEAVTQGDSVEQNDVGRCYRYAPDYPGLAGKDLTPGDPIELYVIGIESNLRKTPEGFTVYNNYPNPFNSTTILSYQLQRSANVSINIYNVLGKLVKTVINEKQIPAGHFSVQWNGKDNTGSDVASGVYLYKLKTKNFVKVKKMLLVR